MHLLRLAVLLLPAAIPDRPAPEDRNRPDAMRAMLREMERTPSLYARFDKRPTDGLTVLPGGLVGFSIDERQSFAHEQKRWLANKDQYAVNHPLRAAVFAAVEAAEHAHKLTVQVEINLEHMTPKGKAALREQQEGLGMATFQLEQALSLIQDAEEQRAKEPNRFWQAHFDWSRVRLEDNILFLFEHNFVLGQVRLDDPPPLGPNEIGWKLAFRPALTIPEPKAKNIAKQRNLRLEKMQKDYAGTPWAFFAERESERELGMRWSPRKK